LILMRAWEVPMGVLMLKCPETGREFATGIYLDEDSFRRLPDTVSKALVRTAVKCTAGGPMMPA